MTDRGAPVIILGAGGQDGHYLAEHHRRLGDAVLCFSRTARPDVEALDVADEEAITTLIRERRPRVVYQLAALSTTRHEALRENHAAIATGTLNVLEAAWTHSRETRVVAIGSALQFENRGEPIRESDPFVASSVYAVARIQAAYAARYYRSLGLRAYVGYLFHHESPLRGRRHMSARICAEVMAVVRGQSDSVAIGDPSVEKEWGYAGDVAAGLATLASQDRVFEAVVGTGRAYSLGAWTERCFAEVGLSAAGRVREVPGFRAEQKRTLSCPETLLGLGWSPKVGFDELAGKMMRRAMSESGGTS